MARRIKQKSRRSKAPPKQNTAPVTKLLPDDIICGRGPGITTYKGNLTLRYLCSRLKQPYKIASRDFKTTVAKMIIDELSQEYYPSGRFVELLPDTIIEHGKCRIVPLPQAVEKVCQTLREKKIKCPRQFQAADKKYKPCQLVTTRTSDVARYEKLIQEQMRVVSAVVRSLPVQQPHAGTDTSTDSDGYHFDSDSESSLEAIVVPDKAPVSSDIAIVTPAARVVVAKQKRTVPLKATPKRTTIKRQLHQPTNMGVGPIKKRKTTIRNEPQAVPLLKPKVTKDVVAAASESPTVDEPSPVIIKKSSEPLDYSSDSGSDSEDDEYDSLPRDIFQAASAPNVLAVTRQDSPPRLTSMQRRNPQMILADPLKQEPNTLWKGTAESFYMTWMDMPATQPLSTSLAAAYPPVDAHYPYCFAHNILAAAESLSNNSPTTTAAEETSDKTG